MSNKLYKNNAVILKQTDSYNDLKNSTKPMINSIILEGNKTSDELNMYTKDQINQLIAQVRNVRYLETIPADPQANTLYYIGTAKPYNVYLYIENSATGTLTRLDMGTTEIDLTEYQKSQDNNLQTTSKNIVGAINENKTNIGQKQNITDNTLITTNKTIVTAINEIAGDYAKNPTNITNQMAITFNDTNWTLLQADGSQRCTKLGEGIYYVYFIFINDPSYTVPLNTEIKILSELRINGRRPLAGALSAMNVTNTSVVGCTWNGSGSLYVNFINASGSVRVRVSGVLTDF